MSSSDFDRPHRNVFAVVAAIVTVFLCGYIVGSRTTDADRDIPRTPASRQMGD